MLFGWSPRAGRQAFLACHCYTTRSFCVAVVPFLLLRASLPLMAPARCWGASMALLAHDEKLTPDVRRMEVTEIAVHARLRGGEPHGHLGFGLDDLFNPNLCDLKAVRVLQFIDEGELHLIALVHYQTRWQPDLGAVEHHGHHGELRGFCGCASASAQQHDGQTHPEPAEAAAPTMDRSHHPVSFLLYRLSPVVPLVLERGNLLRKKYARQRRRKRVPAPPWPARPP